MTYLRRRSRARGVLNTTELILIIGFVVVLAVLALMGVGRNVMTQAASSKATIIVSNPQGWYFTGISRAQDYVFVQFSVTNMGDKPVTITSVKVLLEGTSVKYTGTLNKEVRPGETVIITAKLQKSGYGTVTFKKTETLVVEYRDSTGRAGQVIHPIVMTTP